MYIQQSHPELPFGLPRDYSGNAFRPEEPPAAPPEQAEPNIEEGQESAPQGESEAPTDTDSESVPTLARSGEERGEGKGGLLSRLPFLSSLLPPPRRRGEKEGGLPEWAVLAVLLLLLGNDSREDDILPFLLLLLLWN